MIRSTQPSIPTQSTGVHLYAVAGMCDPVW